MKIVTILGSPHGPNGATGSVLNDLVSAARAAGADVTSFSLTETEVQPCRACDACHRTGTCPIKDQFLTIRDAMMAADGIVLASPNYIFSVSAQLKTLMDRCCGPLHCHSFQDKHAAAIVTSGGPESAEVGAYLERFLRCLGCWTVGSVGAAGSGRGAGQAVAGSGRTRRPSGARWAGASCWYKAVPAPGSLELSEQHPMRNRVCVRSTTRAMLRQSVASTCRRR